MADKKVGLEIDVPVDDIVKAAKSLKELKQLIKEAKSEALNFEEGTKEFNHFVQVAAAAEDKMRDVKETVAALDPGAKAQAFVSLGQSIAGGFAMAQGAAALFGSANEDVEKALLKVQSATAILQGLQAVADGKRQVQILRTIALTNLETGAQSKNIVVKYAAIAAQWLLNAAMNASPLGIMIALITAATAAWAYFSSSSDDAAKAQGELNKEMEKNLSLLERQQAVNKASRDLNLQLAQAQGKSEQELYEIKKRNMDLDHEADLKRKQALKDILAGLEAQRQATSDVDERNKIVEKYNETVNQYAALNDALQQFNQKQQILEAEHQKNLTDAETKGEDDRKKKREEAQKQQLEWRKQAQRLKIEGIDDEREKEIALLDLQLKEELAKITGNSKAANELRKQLKLQHSNDLFDIEQAYLDKELDAQEQAYQRQREAQKKRDEEQAQYMQDKFASDIALLEAQNQSAIAKRLELEQYNYEQAKAQAEGNDGQLQIVEQNHQAELLKLQKEANDAKLANEQAVQEAKYSIVMDAANSIVAIGQLITNDQKKLEKLNKAAALVQIGIDTARAISALVAASSSNPLNGVTGGIAGIAQYAAGITQILTNVAKAKQLLSGSGSSASASTPSGGTAPSLPNTSAAMPEFRQQGVTTIERGGNNAGQSQVPTIRAYVVETEITDKQKRTGNIENRARRG